jgi:hypothetical protein
MIGDLGAAVTHRAGWASGCVASGLQLHFRIQLPAEKDDEGTDASGKIMDVCLMC